MKRLPFLLAILLIVPAPTSAQREMRLPRPGTEILWDQYGVPHVYARDARSLFYAFGWAQMQSHGNLVLRLYGQARGRAAEYWGEDYLESDRWVRLNGIPERADNWYRLLRPEFRAYIDAFVAGMNAYAAENETLIGAAERQVLPALPSDVLAHINRVVHYTFLADPLEIGAAREALSSNGSNGWAIAPQRSATGNALLLANPHLPWGDLFTWYEAQLNGPDVQLYGAALVGMPMITIGFNDRLGWTHTVNTIDGADLYQLTLEADGYRWNGSVRAFDRSVQPIRVRTQQGERIDSLVILRSVHGPVVAVRDGQALALRVAGNDQPHLLQQYWMMGRARSLREFEEAIRPLQLPMFTILYADRDGHIMHVFNGRIPVRSQGDWSFWRRPVRGDTSALLWIRTHEPADLPVVLDPASGWLQNANDPPWSTTLPPALEAGQFPSYFAPRGTLGFRQQHSLRMISADSSITFEELIAYKQSTQMEAADRILDELIAATRTRGTARARRAADVLAAWDHRADAESRGAVLFERFMRGAQQRRWPGNSMYAVRFSESRPLTTPDGLSDAEQAVAVLDEAAEQVERTYGALDVAWGEVYRLQRDSLDLPASGASGALGSFRVLDYEPAGARFRATGGDSFIALVEFGRSVRASTLLPYGNASQPGSPHRTNQLELFARRVLRPAWLQRAEVLTHLSERKRF